MPITLDTIDMPDSGLLEVNVHQIVDIKVYADTARRRVTRYAGDYIGDLLYGENPTLVLQGDRAVWRVPIVIATGAMGRIGQVGVIDVDVGTGELNVIEELTEEIKQNAHRLVTRSPL